MKDWEGSALRFQIPQRPLLLASAPPELTPGEVVLGGKSPCVERCPKMKVQRECGCKTAAVQVSNLTVAGSNWQEEHVTWDRGRGEGLGAKSYSC